jgi:hypothetical protein
MTTAFLFNSITTTQKIEATFNSLVRICPTPVNEEDKKKFQQMIISIRCSCHNILNWLSAYICPPPPPQCYCKRHDGFDGERLDHDEAYDAEDD